VTKRDEGGKGVIFSKIASRHLWTIHSTEINGQRFLLNRIEMDTIKHGKNIHRGSFFRIITEWQQNLTTGAL